MQAHWSKVPQNGQISLLAYLARPTSPDIALSGLEIAPVPDSKAVLRDFQKITILQAPEMSFREAAVYSDEMQLLVLKIVQSPNFCLITPNLLMFKVQIFGSTVAFAPTAEKLLYLDIAYANNLTHLSLCSCRNLEFLRVSNSALEHVDLSSVPGIRYIVLRSGRISEVTGLIFCPKIIELWLDDNRLYELPNLYTLEHLRTLSIDDNQFEFLDFSNLTRLSRLSYLRNPLRYRAKIPYSLYMCNNTYKDRPEFPEALFCLRELKHIIMRDKQLCDMYELIKEHRELYEVVKQKIDAVVF